MEYDRNIQMIAMNMIIKHEYDRKTRQRLQANDARLSGLFSTCSRYFVVVRLSIIIYFYFINYLLAAVVCFVFFSVQKKILRWLSERLAD